MARTYLFTVNPATPPTMTIDPGAEIEVIVDGAFDDIEDIARVPTPFTPESEGHPLAPVTGPIAVRGARPGDSVAIDLLAIEPFGEGANAVLRDFGVLREEFAEPAIVACPIRDGKAWFAGRVAIPLAPNLGTLSTMPPEGYRPSHAGAYGGDFDQRDVGAGARVHLPVLVDDALVFMADPHAAISDGIISGTGVECSARVRARIALVKESPVSARSSSMTARCRSSATAPRSRRRPRMPPPPRSAWSPAGPGSPGARPTCCSASSASCASAPRPGPPWRRG